MSLEIQNLLAHLPCIGSFRPLALQALGLGHTTGKRRCDTEERKKLRQKQKRAHLHKYRSRSVTKQDARASVRPVNVSGQCVRAYYQNIVVFAICKEDSRRQISVSASDKRDRMQSPVTIASRVPCFSWLSFLQHTSQLDV